MLSLHTTRVISIRVHWTPFGVSLLSNVAYNDVHYGNLHLHLDKMAAISQMTISLCIFMNEKFCILIKISLKFVPKGPIGN